MLLHVLSSWARLLILTGVVVCASGANPARAALSITLNSHANGQILPDTGLDFVGGQVTDTSGSGIDKVSLYIGDAVGHYWSGGAWLATRTPLAPTWTNPTATGLNWSRYGSAMPDVRGTWGRYTLTASVWNKAGEHANAVVTVTIDGSLPYGMVDSTTYWGTLGLSDLFTLPAIKGRAYEEGSGFASGTGIQVFLKRGDVKHWTGSNWASNQQPLPITVTGLNWTVTADKLPRLPNLPDGNYEIYFRLTDRAGNYYDSTENGEFYGFTVHRSWGLSITQPTDTLAFEWPGFEGEVAVSKGINSVRTTVQRNSDGHFWNGAKWQSTKVELPAALAGDSWRFTQSPPEGKNLLPGRYTLTVKSYLDTYFVYGHSTHIDVYDGYPPSISMISPANGATVPEFPAAISGGVWDISPVTMDLMLLRVTDGRYWTGTDWANATGGVAPVLHPTIANDTWTLPNPPPVAGALYGVYQLSLYATDKYGGSMDLHGYFLVGPPDTAPPTVSMTTPAKHAMLSSLTAISGTALDNPGGSGIYSLGVYLRRVGDGNYWNPYGRKWDIVNYGLPVFSASGHWAVDGAQLPTGADLIPGRYFISATARDWVGNASHVVADITIGTPETTPPVVSFTSPTDGALLTTLPPITGTVHDSGGSGLGRVTLRLVRLSDGRWWDGATWNAVEHSLGVTVASGQWARTATLPGGANLPDGAYQLTVHAYDLAGNRGMASITVQCAAVAPSS